MNLSQFISLLRSDPAQDRRDANGFVNANDASFPVQYDVHFGGHNIPINLARILPARKKPAKLAEGLPYAKQHSIGGLISKMKQLGEGGEE